MDRLADRWATLLWSLLKWGMIPFRQAGSRVFFVREMRNVAVADVAITSGCHFLGTWSDYCTSPVSQSANETENVYVSCTLVAYHQCSFHFGGTVRPAYLIANTLMWSLLTSSPLLVVSKNALLYRPPCPSSWSNFIMQTRRSYKVICFWAFWSSPHIRVSAFQ